MKLDLSNKFDLNKAKTRFKLLCEKGAKIELKEVRKVRSLRQNAYLHVVITLFAIETGYNLEEAKTFLKSECGFMNYEKNGFQFLKRTRDMDSLELTNFIEWIRNFASQQGLYIPTSDEYLEQKFYIDQQIEQNKNYL